MKTVTFIKKLNNTELGKSGTHDTYIYIPPEVELNDVFPILNQNEIFVDLDSKASYNIKMTTGRETRVSGLGQYYRDKELNAGDEIAIQVIKKGDNILRYLQVRKYDKILVLKSSSSNKSFEILNPEQIDMFKETTTSDGKECKLEFYESRKKRNDSPETTDYYRLLINGVNVAENYSNNETLELTLKEGSTSINKPNKWKVTKVETED